MTIDLELWLWTMRELDRQLSRDPRLAVEWCDCGVEGGTAHAVSPCAGYDFDSFNYCDPANEGEGGSAGSWQIHFDKGYVEAQSRDCPEGTALLRLMGLNFHELGHVLFTHPEIGFIPGLPDRPGQVHYALNALEDQRIERLMIAAFPIAEAPLASLAETLFEDWSEPGSTGERAPGPAVVVEGRAHVPLGACAMARAIFRAARGSRALEGLISIAREYVGMGRPDLPRQHALAETFARLAFDPDPLDEASEDEPVEAVYVMFDSYDLNDDFGSVVDLWVDEEPPVRGKAARRGRSGRGRRPIFR